MSLAPSVADGLKCEHRPDGYRHKERGLDAEDIRSKRLVAATDIIKQSIKPETGGQNGAGDRQLHTSDLPLRPANLQPVVHPVDSRVQVLEIHLASLRMIGINGQGHIRVGKLQPFSLPGTP